MRSLLLLSIVFAALAIPALTARDRDPRRGVRRMVLLVLAFNALYVAYVTLVHPYAFVPKW
jgi:hypothetical protein